MNEHRARMMRVVERTRTLTAALFGPENREFIRQRVEEIPEPEGRRIDWLRDPEHYDAVAAMMRATCACDAPYWVDAELVDLLEVALLDCPDFALHPNDLLTPHGFVIFDRPLQLPSQPPMHGLGWISVADEGVFWSVFGRARGGQFIPDLVNGWDRWQFGETTESWTDLAKLLPAFLRLVQERIIVRQHERPDRALARRSLRSGLPLTELIYVTLRRAAHASQEGSPVDWSHRWLVRGHWRQQWYPSEQRHAPRWIGQHVKGPEGAPLIVKRHQYEVIR